MNASTQDVIIALRETGGCGGGGMDARSEDTAEDGNKRDFELVSFRVVFIKAVGVGRASNGGGGGGGINIFIIVNIDVRCCCCC